MLLRRHCSFTGKCSGEDQLNAVSKCAPPVVHKFPYIAFEMVPMFVWLATTLSHPFKVNDQQLLFSKLLSFRQLMWCLDCCDMLLFQFFEEARHCEQWMARHTELLQNRFARDNIPVEQAELLIHELQVSWALCSSLVLFLQNFLSHLFNLLGFP